MAQCISQLRIKHGDIFHDVPCGRCNFCLQNRRKEWSFRLQKELRYHVTAYFLTLTYHDLAIPVYEDQDGKFVPGLCKSDFQKFMKRLRKRQAKFTTDKIKYFGVGEYGTSTNRPHYHCIVFSLHPKVVSEIGTVWVDGFVHVGDVSLDSIDYITKYVINKYQFKDYVVPPFTLVSNGIGIDHLKENYDRYKNSDTVRGGRGYPQSVPRYYKDKLTRNGFIEELRKKRMEIKAHEKEQKELARLSKLHHDPESYLQERKVASHDRISRKAKKGDKL